MKTIEDAMDILSRARQVRDAADPDAKTVEPLMRGLAEEFDDMTDLVAGLAALMMDTDDRFEIKQGVTVMAWLAVALNDRGAKLTPQQFMALQDDFGAVKA